MPFCHFPTHLMVTKLLTDLMHSLIQQKSSSTKKVIAEVKLWGRMTPVSVINDVVNLCIMEGVLQKKKARL